MNYAVIDIETTGTGPRNDGITEIAIVISDGHEIISEFSTLINPERKIPYHITNITGISNAMVMDAPKFYEVARKILEITEGCTFVAHNAAFDYGFIRSAYAKFGYDFRRETLCTMRLSRKVMPGLKKYGLSALSQHLGIVNTARHRALGDARATTVLLHHLLQIENPAKPSVLRGFNSNLDPAILHALPESTGVYYFLDEEGKIIYVGKSNNIRNRVSSHMNNNGTLRAMEIRNKIATVDFELTGSELIALLLESDEIKRHKPIYNRSQRRMSFHQGLFYGYDAKGYLNFKAERLKEGSEPLTTFTSAAAARSYLEYLVDNYSLCLKLCGLHKSGGACFNHSIHRCAGACIEVESPEQYNKRAALVIGELSFGNESFILIDRGRSQEERSVVLVENGCYRGFGFIDVNEAFHTPEPLRDAISPRADNRDIRQILRTYLKQKRVEKIIPLQS